MIWNVIIFVGILWIIMSVFSFIQAIQINNNFKILGNSGRVFFGRDAGFMRTRIIVFAAADDEGRVTDALKMRTNRFFIPPKTYPLPELKGKQLSKLSPHEFSDNKRLNMAIVNLVKDYDRIKKKG